ncbi:hypothetical protein KEM52_004025 [Ascosphaera acerosa]|nr:hypothetical protein KEM52_004025 [Ascosphaera acerosa]
MRSPLVLLALLHLLHALVGLTGAVPTLKKPHRPPKAPSNPQPQPQPQPPEPPRDVVPVPAPVAGGGGDDDDDDDDRFAALPLVIWHGLGDSYGNPGMKEIATLAQDVNPGTYVYTVKLGDTPNADREASFLGNVTAQIDAVCEQLARDRIVSTAPAVNALGFSQGGQFLRGLIERCGSTRVHNLVTFGSQHAGIYAFQQCESFFDFVCRSAEALLRSGRWSTFAQSRFVPAQYFRDPEDMSNYLEYSNFLADINNERPIKNDTYRDNLLRLNRFAMYMFADDTVAVPKESAFFADVYRREQKVVPLRQTQLYQEDWLGLKVLDEQGRLAFQSVKGEHMQLTDDVLRDAFTTDFAPVDLTTLATSRPPRSGPGLVSQQDLLDEVD